MKDKPDYYAMMRGKILASMILLPVIPFILVVVIGYYHFTNSLQTNSISKMTRIVEDHRRTIEQFLEERRSDLQFIADQFQFDAIRQPEALKEVFGHLQRKSDAFVDLGIFDKVGFHTAYEGPYELAGKVYKDAPWFKEVMEKGYYISDVFLGYRNVPHFIIAIAKPYDGHTWVIRATIDTLMFNDMVEAVRIGRTGEAYILNREGVFQTERRSGGELMERDSEAFISLTPHRGIRTSIEKGASGENYLYATTWLKDDHWMLVVRQEKADAFRALRSAGFYVFLIAILGGAVIVATAFYVTGRIIRRMERLDREKSQLSQQLIVASRLAEIGEMSAGFAHEINNPLQIIRAEQTMVDTILDDLEGRGDLKPSEDLKEMRDSVHQIKIQVDRCSEVTQAILKFARQKDAAPQEVDLRAFIPEVASLVMRKASVDGIKVTQEISDEYASVRADAAQLQQVLVNLLNNAIDAIIERHGSEGGELRIESRPSDGKVEISVTDNGCGISPENMEKIFAPFFTTKPVGKGTGLGLSVCFGIIDKMGGTIGVSSEKGKGSAFTVSLPAS